MKRRSQTSTGFVNDAKSVGRRQIRVDDKNSVSSVGGFDFTSYNTKFNSVKTSAERGHHARASSMESIKNSPVRVYSSKANHKTEVSSRTKG